ncbi:MAG: hypothetical protein V3U56_00560 [Syntrophobacteria bacterium]
MIDLGPANPGVAVIALWRLLLMGQGGGYSTTSNSRHFMAVSLLRMHQIFMLAFAGLRVEGEVAQVLVVSQPPPLACVAHNIFGGTSLDVTIDTRVLSH